MFALSFLCLVPQNFNPLPFLYFSFVREIRFITKTKYVSFVFTMPNCHLTIITPMQWIKVDHVLWSDSWETLHWRNALNARPNKICAATSLLNPMEMYMDSQNINWKDVQMKKCCRPDDSVKFLRAPWQYRPYKNKHSTTNITRTKPKEHYIVDTPKHKRVLVSI